MRFTASATAVGLAAILSASASGAPDASTSATFKKEREGSEQQANVLHKWDNIAATKLDGLEGIDNAKSAPKGDDESAEGRGSEGPVGEYAEYWGRFLPNADGVSTPTVPSPTTTPEPSPKPIAPTPSPAGDASCEIVMRPIVCETQDGTDCNQVITGQPGCENTRFIYTYTIHNEGNDGDLLLTMFGRTRAGQYSRSTFSYSYKLYNERDDGDLILTRIWRNRSGRFFNLLGIVGDPPILGAPPGNNKVTIVETITVNTCQDITVTSIAEVIAVPKDSPGGVPCEDSFTSIINVRQAAPTPQPFPAPVPPTPPFPCRIQPGLNCTAPGGVDCKDYQSSLQCGDRPKMIKFRYTGEECTGSNDQGGTFQCGFFGGDGVQGSDNVRILAYGNSGVQFVYADLWDVHVGDEFELSGFANFPMDTNIVIIIFDASGNVPIQGMALDIRCDGPMATFAIGDKYGAVDVVSFDNDAQGSVPLLTVTYYYVPKNIGLYTAFLTRLTSVRHGTPEDLLPSVVNPVLQPGESAVIVREETVDLSASRQIYQATLQTAAQQTTPTGDTGTCSSSETERSVLGVPP